MISRLRRLSLACTIGAVLLWGPAVTAKAADTDGGEPDARRVLALIEANGGYAFAAAVADGDAAKARVEAARAALYPRLTLNALGQRYHSESARDTGRTDAYGTLEVVQPLYDFGRTYDNLRAARSDVAAAEDTLHAARNAVLLEGLAIFFDLHASELLLHALDESHASAYVRWERAQERQKLNTVDPVTVAKRLVLVEKTRLALYRERSRNRTLRLRLDDLTGTPFKDELIAPPEAPRTPPSVIDGKSLAALVEARNPTITALVKRAEALGFWRNGSAASPRVEAFGSLGHSTRDLRGRNEWAAGARVVWPIFDGGIARAEQARLAAEQAHVLAQLDVRRRDTVRALRTTLMSRTDAWQQIVAARARLDFAKKNLLRRQRLYAQERVADLGRAMITFTEAEADIVRAAGAFFFDNARLAVLLGESPARGLDSTFVEKMEGVEIESEGQGFTPKEGSGFGQDDQEKIDR